MQSRTKNTKRNIAASYILMIVQMLFSFVSRTVIIRALGSDYLGLSSLFTSILQVLNIAESGFSSSVIYFMYKPLADGDTNLVCALLNYLRKVYKVVGTVILGIGLLVTPFITYLIKGDVPADINVYVLYILYLINTSISYFLFAYRTSLLTAIQRLDLTKIANTVVIVLQYALQLIALLVFHNYYLFVIAMIIGTGAVNLFTAYISKKKYPEYKCKGEIDQSSKEGIANKVKGLLICNISGVTYTSLDSIIISAFIGLSSVAIYNNYLIVFTTISSFIVLIRHSMQASVGNSVASETIEKNLNDIKLWQFLFSVIATWCTTCLICLYQPFMTVWMGNHMLLPFIDVIIIGIWFMQSIVSHSFYLYLSATGLWNEMKWAYIFSTVFNLVMNIVLGKLIGITGIILASLLAGMISGQLWQCSIIFKYYFKRSAKEFIMKQLIYFFNAGVIALITYFVCNFIKMGGIQELIIKMVICTILSATLIFLLYHKSQYFIRSKQLMKKVIQRQ